MVERVVILPDVHLTTEVPEPYQLVKKFIKKYRPHEIIILGDFMECESVCHWLENKKLKLEGKRILKEFATANRELDFLQSVAKKVVYCVGNHEQWLTDYIEKHPEVEGLLELDINLRFKERGIKVIPLNKLYKKGKCYFTHGLYTGQHHAKKHLLSLGCNIVYGHTHQAQNHMTNQKMQEPYMAWSLPCLCNHSPYFMKNKPCNWMNGFATMEVGSQGKFSLVPINIINNTFIHEGKEYK